MHEGSFFAISFAISSSTLRSTQSPSRAVPCGNVNVCAPTVQDKARGAKLIGINEVDKEVNGLAFVGTPFRLLTLRSWSID